MFFLQKSLHSDEAHSVSTVTENETVPGYRLKTNVLV